MEQGWEGTEDGASMKGGWGMEKGSVGGCLPQVPNFEVNQDGTSGESYKTEDVCVNQEFPPWG